MSMAARSLPGCAASALVDCLITSVCEQEMGMGGQMYDRESAMNMVNQGASWLGWHTAQYSVTLHASAGSLKMLM